MHFDNERQATLISKTGVKQGHALGGVIYAIGKQAVYEEMAAVDD